MPAFGDNPFLDFLEEEPKAAYFGFQDAFGRSPLQKQFFKNRFQQIHDEFMGKLGSQIMGGELPTLRFTDFLQNMPWQQRFLETPESMRGGPPRGQFAPKTRSLFFG